MKCLLSWVGICVFASLTLAAPPKPTVNGLKNPESVAMSMDGRLLISVIGEFDKDGDGGIMVFKNGKTEPFAMGMDDPKGIVVFQNWLYVADKTRVRRVDLRDGKADILVEKTDFPTPPQFLNDIAVDEYGTLYVSDSGDRKGSGGAIFKITTGLPQKGFPKIPVKTVKPGVTLVADAKKYPFLKTPNGLLLDSLFHLLVLDFMSGELHRLRLSDGQVEKVADGFSGGDGLCFDRHGRLYISSWSAGKVWSIPRPGEKPVLIAEGMESAADLCLDTSNNKKIIVPDMKAGTLVELPAQVLGWEVDETPLPLETAIAFGGLKWTGWENGEGSGKVVPFRPIVFTHAADGSGRHFVATQHGVIHSFKDDSKETTIFLDLQKKVFYSDNENEQGLLGFAFHPKFKDNGEFFLFYTVKQPRLTNVLSRFRVRKDDPSTADPASEEELLRISHKFWNHDGGTVRFGADGYLYLVLGDGGSANDPDDNGQKMSSLLGKILRIDVDRKGEGKPYGIPKDNPFLNQKDALPEIYALGVRNPWRLTFDRKTGQGWFGEVGQNLWEEINLLEKGGNYGWRRRESLHPFWSEGSGPKKEYIEPIWEYHHDIGKSITGGEVYRGKLLPELDGHYLYADYVSGRIWALKYDEAKKRVVANRPIKDRALPILSFGEDEKGEVYLMTYSSTGRGIYKFVRSEKSNSK